MPPDVKDMARLWDMLDAARAITEFIAGQPFENYLADRKTRNAVERNLEIIGEAARHVSEESRTHLAEVPWTSVIGLRNIIIHEYGEIRHEKIWAICVDRLPPLIDRLERLGLENPPTAEED